MKESDYELVREAVVEAFEYIREIEELMTKSDGLPELPFHQLVDLISQGYGFQPFYRLRLPGSVQALHVEDERLANKVIVLLSKTRTRYEEEDLRTLCTKRELIKAALADWFDNLRITNKELQRILARRPHYLMYVGTKWELRFFDVKYQIFFRRFAL